MDARRTWLKHLANSNSVQKWARSCGVGLFSGTSRVQTRNTTYLFRHGSCFAVTTGDASRTTVSDFVGMKLVGWLLANQGQLYLTRDWQPGVCAVLWGSGAPGSLPVALTSPTQRFARFENLGDPEHRPMFEQEPDPTFTRINLPMQLHDSAVRPIARAV